MTDDRLITIVDEGLGNSSYVLDLGDKRALVLDPSRDPSPYQTAAGRRGLRIAFAAETHLHADFVSGSRELAAGGAQILASAAGGLEFPHRGLYKDDEVDLGGLTLRALATPGHTPEHLAYLLVDDRRPLALFSGGSLLVDAVARTDLVDPAQSEELARALWRSLHAQILSLPDELAVYPTHGAGSFCSAPAGGERVTTIGRERAANPLLAARDEDDFVRRLFAGLGSFPTYFLRLREVNRRGPKVYGPAPEPLVQLDVARVQELRAEGTQLIEPRPIESFALGHIPGRALHPPARFLRHLARLAGRPRSAIWPSCSSPDRIASSSCANASRWATSASPASWPAACRPGRPRICPWSASKCCTPSGCPTRSPSSTCARRASSRAVTSPGRATSSWAAWPRASARSSAARWL